MKTRRWRSSTVEQLICNQQAAGSIPIASSAATEGTRSRRTVQGSFLGSTKEHAMQPAIWPSALFDRTRLGGVPERSKGTDCKSVATGFEGSNPSPSTSLQIALKKRNPCRAGVAQLAEL